MLALMDYVQAVLEILPLWCHKADQYLSQVSVNTKQQVNKDLNMLFLESYRV